MNYIKMKEKWGKLTRRDRFGLILMFGIVLDMMILMVAGLFGLPA